VERSPDSRTGTAGWAAIGSFVIAFDLLSKESLTHAFERARESESVPIKALALGTLAVTTAHLVGVIPRQVDPFYRILDRISFTTSD
jgi:hypothetical protein